MQQKYSQRIGSN